LVVGKKVIITLKHKNSNTVIKIMIIIKKPIIIIIIRLPEKHAQLQTRQQRTRYKHIDKCTEWTSM